MKLGKVIGKLWATQKDPALHGVKIYVLQPLDEHLKPMGKALIATDAVGSGEGDLVYWVGAREATFSLADRKIPSDAAIVGIVDDTWIESKTRIEATRKKLQDTKINKI